MVNSKTFDLTVNAFRDLVAEVFSGTNENQKTKLRKMLNQFTRISRKRKTDGQIISTEVKNTSMLDTLISNHFPKEINKAKINEISEILQSHKRPDLVKEIKNLVLLNTRAIDFPNMTEMDTSTTKVLPTEMLKAVLEKLGYKSLSSARQICKRWKEIIDGFKLVEKAFGKHLMFNYELKKLYICRWLRNNMFAFSLVRLMNKY